MTLPLVIGIAGFKRSGKDTLGRHFADVHGYEQRAFATPLKQAARTLNPIVDLHTGERLDDVVHEIGWERAKEEYPEVRRTLQHLGTDVIRNLFGVDVWVDLMGLPPASRTVITDVRFPNEVDAVHAARGVVVRVVRPGCDGDGHATETALDGYDLPVVANDAGIQELWLRGENVVRRTTEELMVKRRRPAVTIGCTTCGSYAHTVHEHPAS